MSIYIYICIYIYIFEWIYIYIYSNLYAARDRAVGMGQIQSEWIARNPKPGDGYADQFFVEK